MNRVQIRPLTFRDICFVAANIRQEDWNECKCQLEEENKFVLANYCYFSTPVYFMWCAYLDGQPVTAFGISKTGPTLGQIWLFSTKYVRKVFPTLLRFMDTEVRNICIENGLRRIEIRAMETHEFVQKGWLESIGAIDLGLLPQYGKNGEDFRLYAWWKGMPDERDIRNCYNRLRGSSFNITSRSKPLPWRDQSRFNDYSINGSSLPELNVR
jgi:hypothetical protein